MRRSLYFICISVLIIVMEITTIILCMTCLYFSIPKGSRKILFECKKDEYVSTNDDVDYFVEAYYDQTYQERT